MAPALTAEPLSPKEKLTNSASPATGTRQSTRKLESPSGGEQTKKPISVASTTTATVALKRVTRSKDAAQRTGSSIVQVNATINNNNKRKSNNNVHNNSSNSAVKPNNDQMGLSAATTHTNNDGSAASSSSSSSSNAAAATAASSVSEHNNNCKDNSTAELLANLTSEFKEAITAEICLRKTLPEVSLSKEQPANVATAVVADPVQELQDLAVSMSEAQSQSTSLAAADAASTVTATPASTPFTDEQQQLVQRLEQVELPSIANIASESTAQLDAVSEVPDSLEERLSQLDGSASAVLPPIDISAASLEASVPLPTTPSRLQQQIPQQHQTEILASPQHSISRQSGAILTPQSTASSINFLKDGTAGAVLEDQDFEEVLKALKTLDGGHVNPDTICDFNFFNEVCFLNNEEDAAAANACTTTGAAGVSTSGNHDIPVPGLDVHPEECLPKSNCSNAPQPRPWLESLAELEQTHQQLCRKLDFMLRRARKYQSRHMCRHASDEVAGILEWSARTSHKAAPAAPVRSTKLTEQEDTVLSIVSGRPGNSFWEEQIKQPLPASQMSNVLRHIESSARKQQICHTIGGGSASLASSSSWYSSAAQPGKRARKQQPTDAISSSSTNATSDALITARADEIVPNYDNYVTSELTHVAGLLHTEMREVQNAIDSDATESSSGGDSADEMVNYNNSQQRTLPITRRAVWRYSRDRAAIALRWSWVNGQLTDLDMKIRQYNDVYNDLCRNKGDVLLETTPAPKNGYRDQQQLNEPLEPEQASADYLCSRARPLVLTEFRKRKLFQTTNMHTISKKAARPSNIKCGCQWPQVPCTLCTGRPDPTAPRELAETLMPQNRTALLDPGYHPVLSFTDDTCQSLHLEAISRQPDWQYRVMRSQPKAIVKSVWKAEREAIALSGGGGSGSAARRPGETAKRRYVRRKERNNNNSNSNNNSNRINNNNSGSNNKQSTIPSSAFGVDSGNGTGTATTSTSSTPTTTPLVANTAVARKQQRQLINTSLQLPDSRQLNNPSLISSGNSARKPRKSASTQQHQHSAQNIKNHHSNNNSNNSSRCSSQQPGGVDYSGNRVPGDSQWEQQQHQQQHHSRRNSSETHGHRNERSSERRNRLIYDIDNIVIPYSIAAQTRVEILPYKEIPTPKWRIVDSDEKNAPHSVATDPNPTEKLSNGCAAGQRELESKSKATEIITKIISDKTSTPTTTPAAALTPTTTPAAALTPTTTPAAASTPATIPATTATKERSPHKPNNNNCVDAQKILVKSEPVKINGIKPVTDKQQLPEPVIKLEPQKRPMSTVSNGLVNGNDQLAMEKKEQGQEQVKDLKQKTAASRPNGKIKKNKHKNAANNNDVNKIAEAVKKEARNVAAKESVEPPPLKRPKLQLEKTAIPDTQTTSAVVVAADAEDDNDELEDITDHAYIVRHQRALIEERRRFETFLKFPWSTRSRANRRADSRAESSGANTPDPASPAAPHPVGPTADNESIPSPLAQTVPQHPLDAFNVDNIESMTKRQERRRTTSSKLKEYDRRSATPDTRELALEPTTFEPLMFPLSAEIFQRMQTEMYVEPRHVSIPASGSAKRTKSKSVSSNGGDGSTSINSSNRRNTKAKVTGKQAQTATSTKTTTMMNGGKNAIQQATGQYNGYDTGVDYEPEDEEDVELLLEEDDDFHYLAPQDDPPPAGTGDNTSQYNASIDAYLGENEGLDEEELGDDPFIDDDPNDPEWKRSVGVRNERIRKRV